MKMPKAGRKTKPVKFFAVYFSNKAMKSDFKKLTPVSLSLKMSIRGTGII